MKHEWKKYIVLFLTAVMLFACAAAEGAQETAAIETQAAIETESAAADEEKVITLPAQLTIIEEEAFYGSAAIGHVIVPEGVEEIRARAFADSGLTAIELPASLTMIADDAFDGVSGLTATVMDGSYAKTYCEALGIAYTMPDMPIVIRSILPEATTVEIDGYGRWTVDAAGSYTLLDTSVYRYELGGASAMGGAKRDFYAAQRPMLEEIDVFLREKRLKDACFRAQADSELRQLRRGEGRIGAAMCYARDMCPYLKGVHLGALGSKEKIVYLIARFAGVLSVVLP